MRDKKESLAVHCLKVYIALIFLASCVEISRCQAVTDVVGDAFWLRHRWIQHSARTVVPAPRTALVTCWRGRGAAPTSHTGVRRIPAITVRQLSCFFLCSSVQMANTSAAIAHFCQQSLKFSTATCSLGYPCNETTLHSPWHSLGATSMRSTSLHHNRFFVSGISPSLVR